MYLDVFEKKDLSQITDFPTHITFFPNKKRYQN